MTSTLTRYLACAVASLLILCAGTLWCLKMSQDKVASTEAQVSSLTAQLGASQALTARIQKQVTAANTKAAKAQQELRNALKENAEWAAGAVPPAVSGVLCQPPAKCAASPTGVQ